jgi:hypothetical protein
MLSRHKGFSSSVLPAPRLAPVERAPNGSLLPSVPECDRLAWGNKRVAPSERRSSDRAICALGFSARDLSDLRALVGEDALLPPSVKSVSELIANGAPFGQATHAIVNLDAFDAVEDAVDWLLRFRQTKPDCIVLAVSSFVLGDDLGSDRRAICDATLRWPISKSRFDAGLRAAEEATGRDFTRHFAQVLSS